ncbi:MAG: tetratricopeptide repeat protein [Acidobacteria bacterium]|nr:tetratricopeptide repeat protein [Acidobacteriota bacterium]
MRAASRGLTWCCLAGALLLAQSPHELHLDKGAEAMRARRFDTAIKEFTRAVVLSPRSGRAHLLLGEAYLATGSPGLLAEAKAEFQQARELTPSLSTASFYIAKIDLDLGRLERAERAIAGTAPSPYLDALLGEVRRQQGRSVDAVRLASKALAAAPDVPLFLYYRALAYWDDGRQESAALADLARSVDQTPEMHILAAKIHLWHKRPAEAEVSLRRSLALGERAEAYLRLAQAHRLRNDRGAAQAALTRFRGAPQLPSVHFERLNGEADREEAWLGGGSSGSASPR